MKCPALSAPSTFASALRAPTDGPPQGTPVFSILSALFPVDPNSLAPPTGFQLLGEYQIVAPAADESLFLAPLGFNPQPRSEAVDLGTSDITVMEIELATDKVADSAYQCHRVYFI